MTLCLIQARLGSTRFPGKVLANLGGKSVITRVYEQACKVRGVDQVRVAYPVPGIDENDVLTRFWWHAQEANPDTIIRLTGDCPLLDPQVVELVLERFHRGDVDYASNVYPRRTWPDGLDCEVFSRRALELAHENAVSGPDREHVTPYMHYNLKCANVELPVDWSWVRLTLDTPEDLEWLRVAIKAPRSG